MRQLYKMTDDFVELQNMLDENPEDEYVIQTLDSIKLEIDDKAANIVSLMKNITTPIPAIDDEIKRLQELKKSIQNTEKRLKEYLQYQMEKMGIEKIETDLVTIRLQKSPPSLIVDNPNIIPEEYKKTEIIISTKTKELKEALKQGAEVPGCHLVSRKHLRII